MNSLGAGMSIGYPISETSRLTYGLSVQRDQIDTGRYTVDEIYDFLDKEGDNFTNFKASIGWSESTLNKGVLATRGHSQSLTLETTLPGSDLSFYKIDYRGQVFAPADRQLHHALPHRAGLWRRLRIHRAPAVLRELLRRRLQLGARLQGQHAGAS